MPPAALNLREKRRRREEELRRWAESGAAGCHVGCGREPLAVGRSCWQRSSSMPSLRVGRCPAPCKLCT